MKNSMYSYNLLLNCAFVCPMYFWKNSGYVNLYAPLILNFDFFSFLVHIKYFAKGVTCFVTGSCFGLSKMYVNVGHFFVT